MQNVYVVMDLFVSYFVEVVLVVCWFVWFGMKCLGKVGVIVVIIDDICVQSNEFVDVNDVVGCFLELEIGVLFGVQ